MLICRGDGIVWFGVSLCGMTVTLGSWYSGIHLLIGSDSRKCPFSYSVIRATDVIGFVMDATLNIVSVVICLLCCMFFCPWALWYAIFPFLAMSVTVPGIVEECGEAGVSGIVIISAGFSEAGKKGQKMANDILRIAKKYEIRVIGPNCLGFIKPSLNLNASFATEMPLTGRIAFVSQSGALGGMIIYTTRSKRIGMSKFASIGNSADVGFVEILNYFREDPKSSVIAAYVEGVDEGRALFKSLHDAAKVKPVVLLKGGRSEAGGRATLSHTGSLTGSTKVFDGMIRQAGCVTAPTLDTLFEICKLFDYQPIPKGNRIGIISNTGGAGVLATDAASELNLEITNLTEGTKEELRQVLPPMASINNPIDVVASGGRREYRIATELLLKDINIDILLVICAVPTFAGMTQTEHAAGTLEGVRSASMDKPVVGVWLAGDVGKLGSLGNE